MLEKRNAFTVSKVFATDGKSAAPDSKSVVAEGVSLHIPISEVENQMAAEPMIDSDFEADCGVSRGILFGAARMGERRNATLARPIGSKRTFLPL